MIVFIIVEDSFKICSRSKGKMLVKLQQTTNADDMETKYISQ